jgi:type VI secretion system protein ImpM
MACGLFGKLPSKRDFVAHNVPRPFLGAFEPWLQSSVATSRQQLGDAWVEAFRHAPIWRYWLGTAVGGVAAIGALMPSIDAVGRYFPLTITAFGEEAGLPPDIDAQEAWFDAVETLLLSTLEPESDYDRVLGELASLPATNVSAAPPGGTLASVHGATILGGYGAAVDEAYEAARRATYPRSYAHVSAWWTVGGENFMPRAILDSRLPHETLLSRMLTGRFEVEG